jgi:hypothetical protein
MKHAHNFQDLTGQKMHRLTFLHFVEIDWRGNAIWKVKCDCGTEFIARAASVKIGNTRSCGCIRIERCKTGFKKFLKHNTL